MWGGESNKNKIMDNKRLIRVTGKGNLRVRPDVTRITITLEGCDEIYEESLRRSTKDTERLKDLLEKQGFARDDASVTFFGLKDHYVEGDKTNARLFDKDLNPKPAFNAVRDIFKMLYQD